MIRSPQALAQMLDAIMSGASWEQAVARIGGTAGAAWQWKRSSRMAEAAGDSSSDFYFAWPSDAEPDYFHHLLDRARARRGELLQHRSRDDYAIRDGKVEWQSDDFGQVLFDEFNLPVPAEVVPAEPQQPRKRVRVIKPPRRELSPASYGRAMPKPPTVPPPNALTDYLKATGKSSRPMSDLERDLRDKLAAGPTNSKPTHPVHVLGRGAGDPPENISRPSDATGLPTRMADPPRREAPQPKPQSADYSRHAPNIRIDAPGRG